LLTRCIGTCGIHNILVSLLCLAENRLLRATFLLTRGIKDQIRQACVGARFVEAASLIVLKLASAKGRGFGFDTAVVLSVLSTGEVLGRAELRRERVQCLVGGGKMPSRLPVRIKAHDVSGMSDAPMENSGDVGIEIGGRDGVQRWREEVECLGSCWAERWHAVANRMEGRGLTKEM
jgi:hypothetical protein